jgi:uncharacterized protein YecE (DUF72 family)
MTGRIRLGAQGWNYDAWVGPFYPPRTRPADFLTLYARGFSTVEVDSTFYAIPPATTVRGWAARVPDDFVFALKMPQEITHERRLRDADDVLGEFLDRARLLGEKLGPILIQLGPEFGPSELPALAQFLPRLPTDLRFAVEFRHRGWVHEGVIALLAEHNVTFAVTDARWIPRKQMLALASRPTGDVMYARWMGPDRTIVDFSRIQIDRTREMELWAGVMLDMIERGLDVYGYVNNHFAGHSPSSVRDLQRLVGQTPLDPEQLGEQMSFL